MSLKPIRPTAKHSPLTGAASGNTYRTQCKRCGLAVHTWQDSVWSTDPHQLGLVHVECEEAA